MVDTWNQRALDLNPGIGTLWIYGLGHKPQPP